MTGLGGKPIVCSLPGNDLYPVYVYNQHLN
jgi:hypothetical protein